MKKVESKIFGKISRNGQDQPTTIIYLLAKDTIDKNNYDVQQQQQRFDVQVLKLRVEGEKILPIKDEIVVLSDRKIGEGNIKNDGEKCKEDDKKDKRDKKDDKRENEINLKDRVVILLLHKEQIIQLYCN